MQGGDNLAGGSARPYGEVLVRSVELNLHTELRQYPDLLDMLAYWNRRRGQKRFPGRGDIDPVEIPQFLPRIMLADVRRDPMDFHYRLVGTGICDVHWFDFTHLTPRELEPPEYAQLVWDDYVAIVGRGEPVAHVVIFESARKIRYYARIVLPLAADGETIDMLMIVDSREQNTSELKEMFEAVSAHTPPPDASPI
jgi:hypothetical protein